MLGWTLVPALVLIAWQVAAVTLAQPWICPSVGRVASELAHPLRDHYHIGSLAGNTLVSLVRVVIGFGLAALVAIPLGVGMGASRTARSLGERLGLQL